MFSYDYMILVLALGSSVAALPTIQIKNGSEILEIADTPSIIEIIEPKTQPAVQRELLLLEIIEKPCKNAEKAKACKEDGPDLDQSLRPFTNSHGYQFIVYGPKNEDNSDEENSNEENKKDRRKHVNESKNDGEEDKYDSNESKREGEKGEKGEKDTIGAQKDIKENPKDSFDNKNDENVDDKGKKKVHEDKKENNENMKHSSEEITEPTKQRRKRQIGNPPPPPVLPPMDVNMFPSFIRNMISNIPVLRNMLAENVPERPVQDGSRPRTYGFHLNKDKASVFNHLYDIPSYDGDKLNKNDERIQKPTPAYVPDDSDSDNDGDDSDDGDNAGTDDEGDKADDGDNGDTVYYVTPSNGLNNKKPVTKDPNLGTENNKDWKQNKPTTEKIVYLNPKSERIHEKTENTNVPISKSGNNVKDNIKDKIEMSINKASEVIPPRVKNVERNPSQLSFDGTPKTFGLKLIGDHGYVWNDLSDPGSHYEVGKPREDKEDKNKPEMVKPKPEPKQPNIVKESKPNEEDVKTNEVTTETSAVTENPNKEQKKEDNGNNEAVKEALDNLLKKDEFWQWLTKWTAAYIEVLNGNIERLVKREVAKQIRKITDAKIEKAKAANVTANKDVGAKNKTANNSTLVEPNNGSDKNIPMKANNTVTKDQSKNDTNVPKTQPKLNSHTIYGNAIDSDHVTNIFIFYPNTVNDTHKELENILNKTNDGVLEKPINSSNENNATTPSSSDGTTPSSSDGTTPNPSNGTIADYAIDKKKDSIPESTSTTTESSPPNNNSTQNPNSNVANSAVANSTVANSTVANSTLENSTVANSNVVNSTVVNSTVVNSTLANISVANNTNVNTEATTPKTELSSSTATPTSVTPDVSSTPQGPSTNGTTTSVDAAKPIASDTTTPVTPQAT